MTAASRRAFFTLLAAAKVPFVIVGEILKEAYWDNFYETFLDIEGTYVDPLIVDLASGALPRGLYCELDVTGTKIRIWGTPSGAISIQDVTLPPAIVGYNYYASIQVKSAVGDVTIDITSGALPSGLSMTWDSVNRLIEIAGIPT